MLDGSGSVVKIVKVGASRDETKTQSLKEEAKSKKKFTTYVNQGTGYRRSTARLRPPPIEASCFVHRGAIKGRPSVWAFSYIFK